MRVKKLCLAVSIQFPKAKHVKVNRTIEMKITHKILYSIIMQLFHMNRATVLDELLEVQMPI